jgi:hypothetical protein
MRSVAVVGVALILIPEWSTMSYTYKSLTFVWLITLGLFGLTGSGGVAGPWVLLLIAVALAAPALILRRRPAGAATSPERPRVVADESDRSRVDPGGIDLLGWENEGGAGSRRVGGGIREPAHAAL